MWLRWAVQKKHPLKNWQFTFYDMTYLFCMVLNKQQDPDMHWTTMFETGEQYTEYKSSLLAV